MPLPAVRTSNDATLGEDFNESDLAEALVEDCGLYASVIISVTPEPASQMRIGCATKNEQIPELVQLRGILHVALQKIDRQLTEGNNNVERKEQGNC